MDSKRVVDTGCRAAKSEVIVGLPFRARAVLYIWKA